MEGYDEKPSAPPVLSDPAFNQGYPTQQYHTEAPYPPAQPPYQPAQPPYQPAAQPQYQPAQQPYPPAQQPYQQPGQAPYPPAGQPPYQATPPGAYPQQPYQGPQYPTDPPPGYYQDKQPPPPVQTQTSTNVVIVQQQQQQPTTTIVHSVPVQDHYYTFSLIMVIISIFCGCIFLTCTLPALFIASSARDEDRFGNKAAARNKGHIALGLNITAIACWCILIFICVIAGAVR